MTYGVQASVYGDFLSAHQVGIRGWQFQGMVGSPGFGLYIGFRRAFKTNRGVFEGRFSDTWDPHLMFAGQRARYLPTTETT